MSDWLDHFVQNARLPGAPEQLANLIRRIGECMAETGDGFPCDVVTETAVVGAFSKEMLQQLCRDAEEAGLIRRFGVTSLGQVPGRGSLSVPVYGLTLQGWDRFEAERKGGFSGRYGFLAMKFADGILDGLAETTIKPAVSAAERKARQLPDAMKAKGSRISTFTFTDRSSNGSSASNRATRNKVR